MPTSTKGFNRIWRWPPKLYFRKVNNYFRNRLKNDKRSIESSKKVFVFADKTRIIYKMENSYYKKNWQITSQKTYKQYNNNIYNSINLKVEHIAKNSKYQTELNVWPENQPISPWKIIRETSISTLNVAW